MRELRSGGDFARREPVRLATEQPLVLDPANPTNNVAYRVSSNDPAKRSWITISREARSTLEDILEANRAIGRDLSSNSSIIAGLANLRI